MTEELIEKKTFKNSDFKFIAAYGAYSQKFDESKEDEEKQRLNDLILKLEAEDISYPDFYEEISKSGEEDERRYRFHRSRIMGSRKFAARKAEQ